MGGFSGLIYSSLPVLVFVPVSTKFGLMPAIYAALGVAALVLIWRLIRRDSLQPAISGFFGVGISALIAYVVGESKGYFLLGIWSSLIYAAVFALSVLIRRPIVGYVWAWVNARDRDWRGVRKAVLAFDLATLAWVLVFGARYVVQHRLYDADQTGLLGVDPHRHGLAADRRGGAGDLSGDPDGPTCHACARGDAGRRVRRAPNGLTPLTGARAAGSATDRPLIAVAVLASFVAFLDGSVVNLALPAIGRELGGGLALQQWVIDGYLLALGALILVAGAVSDQYGRLRVLRAGLGIFAGASLLCAAAPTGWVLVAARCLQGVGAAFLVPSSLGDDQLPVQRCAAGQRHRNLDRVDRHGVRRRATAGGRAGRRVELALGVRAQRRAARRHAVPGDEIAFGGQERSDWGSRRGGQERSDRARGGDDESATASGAIDVVGAVLAAVGLSATVYALIELQRLGPSNPAVLAGLGCGVACLAAFPWWEHRAANPMLPLQLFAERNFAVGNLATVFFYAAVSLGTLGIALFLQEAVGLTATQAGLATLPMPVLSFLLARPFGTLAGRHGPRLYMAVGPRHRCWRVSVDGDVVAAARHVRLLDTGAARRARLRARPFHDGIAADGGRARRSRARPERHRIGGQQRRLSHRRPGRGRLHGGNRWHAQWISPWISRGTVVVSAVLFAIAGLCSALGHQQCRHACRRRSRPKSRATSSVAPARTRVALRLSVMRAALAQLLLDLGDARRTTVRRRPPTARRPRGRSRGRPAGSSPAPRHAGAPALDGLAAPRGVVGQRDLDEVGLPLAEAHQPYQVTDGHRLLDERRQHPRCGDRHVDAPILVEQPLVARIVDPGHDA